MTRIQHTTTADMLARIVASPDQGVISLVGDCGGLSLITGDIDDSSLVMGTMVIETEHGTVYLDPEAEIRISEDDGDTLEGCQTGALFAVNDVMTAYLAERFGWFATNEARYDALNDLTHAVAENLDDLLAKHPAHEPV